MPETLPASFFVVGGTLRRDAPSYIERAADQTLFQALQAGEICYVLTARQMGKSSLMVRTAARLRDSGARVAVLDLTSLGQNLTAEQWYTGLVERAGQQFRLEDEMEECWHELQQIGPMHRFMRVLSDVILPIRQDRVVIFVDEIDAVRSLPFSTNEFFAGIRECYNRRSSEPQIERLTFCLLGVAAPSDLINDTRTTPFNIGRRIELTDFTEQEAMPLLQGMGTDDSTGSALLRRVIYWTGGHPYLTQRLCQAVSQESVRNAAAVDRACKELFLSNRARDRDDNLLFVRDRILRSEVDTAGLLTLYQRVLDGKTVRDDETNPLISVLRLSGIIRIEKGNLKVRCRIYRQVFDHEWVVSNMPGAELRRQRTAYLRGLKRTLAFTLPLIVAALAFGYYNLYSVRNTIAEKHFASAKPPAFWASERISQSDMKADVAGILLHTGQPDVTILVNEVQFGRTSSSGELRIPLPPSSYNLRLEKTGFRPISTSAQVSNNAVTSINVKLEREAPPMFSVRNGLPGATVRLDNKELGIVKPDGTFIHEGPPGTHTVELQKAGYLPGSATVALAVDTTRIVDINLVPDNSGEVAEAAAYAAAANATDTAPLLRYLERFPNGKNAATARNKVEDLDWRKVSRTDLTSLDSFLRSHPQGPHTTEAEALVTELQNEDQALMAAEKASTAESLQAFLNRYSNSRRYSERVRQELQRLRDKEAVVGVLHRFEESYNKKDLASLIAVYPYCPEGYKKAYLDSFRSPERQNLKLDLEEPSIQGDVAIVKGKTTRSGALNASGSFTAMLGRQGDKWVIKSGIY